MGGAVSSGRDNNELIDNLMGGNYIRSRAVERVFRVLDRADYMTPDARDQAYKDLAWRSGPLHMSAPCIYSEVMEGLELRPGLSFLNVGSGTGYLSTLVGLIIGSGGISHGVEVHPAVIEYANKKMGQFIENSVTLDEFDFCMPKYYLGNGLCIAPLQAPYDRVYCGAGCPEEYQNYFKQLIKVGGVLVMPLNDNLVQVRRLADAEWTSRSLLNVSFATLRVPSRAESAELIRLEEQCPPRLQVLARSVIRSSMKRGLCRRHPELREPPPRPPPPRNSCPRRICIPIEDDSDVEGLNVLHDLDRANGANEMNALLSLVLSMGQNRVAGALRFDSLDSGPFASSDEDEPRDPAAAAAAAAAAAPPPETVPQDLFTIEFQDTVTDFTASPGTSAAPTSSERSGGDPSTSTDESGSSREPDSSRASSASASPGSRAGPPGARDGGSPGSSKPDAGDRKDSAKPGGWESRRTPGVPAEVEIYLGKEMAGTSGRGADMEWEVTQLDDASDEEATEPSNDTKRQKLDSGIGDETGPSSGSSPGKSESRSEESDACGRSDSLTDDASTHRLSGRRRLHKRSHCHVASHSSTSTEWSDSGAECGCGAEAGEGEGEGEATAAGASGGADAGAGAGAGEGEVPRRRVRRRGGRDARRVRLSIVMKRGVKELPLPYALKKYVNLGRCFEF